MLNCGDKQYEFKFFSLSGSEIYVYAVLTFLKQFSDSNY